MLHQPLRRDPEIDVAPAWSAIDQGSQRAGWNSAERQGHVIAELVAERLNATVVAIQ